MATPEMSTSAQKTRKQIGVTMASAWTDHEKGLNKHSYFKVHNHDLGEDLVQDTYVKTWNYLLKGGKIHLMRAFLYHTLNCLIIDEYRKKRPVSLEELLENGFEIGSNPTDEMIDALDGKTAMLLIAKLTPKYQKIIGMRFTDDLSLEEMSVITGQTRNAMAVQVHRGLEKLKVLYAHK